MSSIVNFFLKITLAIERQCENSCRYVVKFNHTGGLNAADFGVNFKGILSDDSTINVGPLLLTTLLTGRSLVTPHRMILISLI
jgi:hypothetical protein